MLFFTQNYEPAHKAACVQVKKRKVFLKKKNCGIWAGVL